MLGNLLTAFLLGLATPLTAVCVIPLYPGFISYLSNRLHGDESTLAIGALITAGAITFMFLTGLIFTYVFKASLTHVIGIISPIMFGILAVISILLITGFDFTTHLPKIDSPEASNPKHEAFLFGFFFGGIVLPCNPGMIAALFSIGLATTTFLTTFLQFITFGIGLGTPLLVLAAIGDASHAITTFLTRHQRSINIVTGIIMLAISLYYLIFVFNVI